MDRFHPAIHSNLIDSADKTERNNGEMTINNPNEVVNVPFVKKSSTSFHDIASAPSAQPPNIFPKSNEGRRLDPIYVSVKSNHGGNSPLPPALSPASVSNSHSSAFASSRASPAPQLINEEEGSSNNSINPPRQPTTSFAAYQQSAPILAPKSFEQRNVPPCDTLTTSSSSSSTSGDSSASSLAGDMLPPTNRANGIPVLEKMTSNNPVQRVSSPTKSVQVKTMESVPEASQINQLAQPNSPITVPSENHPVEIVSVVPSDAPTSSLPKKKPTRKSGAAKRRRPQKKRWSNGDDSDIEIPGKQGSILRKYQETVKRSAAQKRGTKAGGRASTAGNSLAVGELTGQQRYLRSPFFCLCQSAANGNLPGGPSTSDPPTAPPPLPAHSAHVINPAVPIDEPIDCPILQANSAAKKRLLRPLDKPMNELSAFFATTPYKPTLRPGSSYPDSRIPNTYTEDACPSWRCVFCAEPPTFDRLSPLYGPYFVSGEVLSKHGPSLRLVIKPIPPGVVGNGSVSIKNLPDITPSPAKKSTSCGSNNKASRVRRNGSLVDAVQVMENYASMTSNRVGSDGEVWCHLECVLWAPGTHIKGDGTIGGLDEAVMMALETTCSHCKKIGAILSCTKRGCNLFYHYYCAKLAECHFNEEQYAVLCKKHYVYS